jgi:hypothetical protein
LSPRRTQAQDLFAEFADRLVKLGYDMETVHAGAFLWLADTADDREDFLEAAEEGADSCDFGEDEDEETKEINDY